MGFWDSISSPCAIAGYSKIAEVHNKNSSKIFEDPATGFKIEGNSFDVYQKEETDAEERAGGCDYCTQSLKAKITGPDKGSLTVVGDQNTVYPNSSELNLIDAKFNEIFLPKGQQSKIKGWNSTNKIHK